MNQPPFTEAEMNVIHDTSKVITKIVESSVKEYLKNTDTRIALSVISSCYLSLVANNIIEVSRLTGDELHAVFGKIVLNLSYAMHTIDLDKPKISVEKG